MTHGPEGIRASDGTSLLETQPFPADIARDHQGGFVFTDADGLWWFAAGELEPELVNESVGELIAVVITSTGPVAMIWEGGPVFYDLGDGRPVDSPQSIPVEVDESSGSLRWTAANGLTAWVTTPEVVTDAEGQPTEVLEPARLLVASEDVIVVDLEIGSVYETWATIHDFDGQRLIVSRGPFEPAAPEETFVVIDLASGEVTGSFIAGGTRATFTEGDSDWGGPVQIPELGFFTPVQIGSDAGITSLDDGRHLVYVEGIFDEGAGLRVDLAVLFSGNEANTAARLDGATEIPVSNDYYIRNQDATVISVPVHESVQVTSVWYDYDTDPDLENDPISYLEFLGAIRGNANDAHAQLRDSPWWVTVESGTVVALDEQYVP